MNKNQSMDSKFDLFVVGELNVDVILNRIEGFPQLSKEIFAHNMHIVLGSSSAIFASNAATMGLRVAFAGMVGKDSFGSLVINELHNKNIDTSSIIFSQKNATGATIALNYGNDRAMITYAGAMAHFSLKDINFSLLRTSRHMHVASIFLQPSLKPGLTELFNKAKNFGLTTSLDPQWDPAERWDLDWQELLPYVDYFMPNAQEIKAITNSDNIEEAVNQLITFSNFIIVKNGTEGSWLLSKEHSLFQPSFVNPMVVDAIGAGDSFDAGFVAGRLRGLSLSESLKTASLAGAINTTSSGGTAAFSSLETIRESALQFFNTKFPI